MCLLLRVQYKDDIRGHCAAREALVDEPSKKQRIFDIALRCRCALGLQPINGNIGRCWGPRTCGSEVGSSCFIRTPDSRAPQRAQKQALVGRPRSPSGAIIWRPSKAGVVASGQLPVTSKNRQRLKPNFSQRKNAGLKGLLHPVTSSGLLSTQIAIGRSVVSKRARN
jgi:hypothetical protein